MSQQFELNPYQKSDAPTKISDFSFSDLKSKDIPPMIGTSALILYGLSRRSFTGLFLAGVGGGLLYRQIKKQTQPDPHPQSTNRVNFKESIIVHQPIEDVFAFWSDLQNIPRFMDHIKSVHKLDDIRSHWQAFIPFTDQTIEWATEITDFQANNLIRWQSTPESDIHTTGIIRFQRLPNGNGTRIHANISYSPPPNIISPIANQFLQNIPKDTVKTDLERFHRLLDSSYPGSGVIDNDISF